MATAHFALLGYQMISAQERISYTLVTDGSSDLSLLQDIIHWVIRHAAECGLQLEAQYADFRSLHKPPETLSDRLREAVRIFPCDILFVHRDAERQTRESRVVEIAEALHDAGIDEINVPVVPVRMTEAWLLISEPAIRRAAGNPNGRSPLDMPKLNGLEGLTDPKDMLHSLLVAASEKHGRRLKAFRRDINWHVHRVADYIDDYSQLECLPAFQIFEELTRKAVQRVTAP
jgi:hypothetical protein